MLVHAGRLRTLVIALPLLVACEGKDAPGGNSGTDTDTDSGTSIGSVSETASTESGSQSESESAGTDSGDSAATDSATTDSTSGTATDSATEGDTDQATTGTNDPGDPLDCGGKTYACGNGIDDDGDGKIDLNDPECTGPCDDDESSFQTGIPGDNVDCKQDCFFDGNSGQGDDGCIWDLKCDPANPGADINCEYTGGNNCGNGTPNQTDDCIMFCTQYVPPGCDCFGCCEVQTDDGPIHIFLNSHPDCALDNLEACQECTPSEDCSNPCEPEKCELCFGEDELDPDCDMQTCPSGDSCDTNDDCATDYFCYLGCCYPPPPG